MPRTPTLLFLLLLLLFPLLTLTMAADHNTLDFANANNIDNNEGTKPSGKCPLKPGENRLLKMHEENCTFLFCTDDGPSTSNVTKLCEAPACFDPWLKEGACCAHCPKGRNCLLPSGEILWGRNVTRMGQALCSCPEKRSKFDWGEDLTNAVCVVTTTPAPTTTTPVPDCRLPEEEEKEEGKESGGQEGGGEDTNNSTSADSSRLLEPGKEKIVPKDNDCRKYVCNATGQLTTYLGRCPQLNCSINGTREPGTCCKTCPDDPDGASSEPTSYEKSSPKPKQRAVLFFDFFTLLRLLFGQTSFSSNHHHHKHGGSHKHDHSKTTGTGTDATGTNSKQNGGKESAGNSKSGQEKASGSAAAADGEAQKKTDGGKARQGGGVFWIFHFGSSGGGHHGGSGGRRGGRWGGSRRRSHSQHHRRRHTSG